jgi:phosphoribosylformimino-5-aminoimidazole carboxamide ribotide isomerase
VRIYPAIDIVDGCCVMLKQGDFKQKQVFDTNPAAVARRWALLGAEYLHIVDLDGARYGAAHSDAALREILRAVDVPVQVGGGIRTMADIRAKLNLGVARVILGTVAAENPDFVREAVEAFGEHIAVGIDARDGKVSVKAWTGFVDADVSALLNDFHAMGVRTVIYTDILKDGMMDGPNVPMYTEANRFEGLDIIASGGVSTISDVRALTETGVHGAIIGSALYLGAVNLREAIETGKVWS